MALPDWIAGMVVAGCQGGEFTREGWGKRATPPSIVSSLTGNQDEDRR